MSVDSIPVYWGNPKIKEDFNTNSFIYLKDSSDIEIAKAIEKIKYLDQNDKQYLEMLEKPWLSPSQFIDSGELFRSFTDHIFSVALHSAKKRALYGWNKYHTERLKNYIHKPLLGNRLLNRAADKVKGISKRISNFIENQKGKV